MFVTCAAEVLLGVRVLFPWTAWMAPVQAAMILGFTLILAGTEPMLLVHPYGMLSKNLPLLAVIAVVARLPHEGWSERVTRWLRGGMAIVWITEGLGPKVLFQLPLEIAVVAGSGLVPMDPSLFLRLLGLGQAASGVAAWILPPRAAAILCAMQCVAVVVLCALVSWQDPLLWVHPFGPMTKDIPILVGTAVLTWRHTRSR